MLKIPPITTSIYAAGLAFLVFLVRLDTASTAAGQQQRPWPLEVPIHLSSSFGEFRSGHLHAGVDIRTFGREGVPCHAVGDGWVSRLRSSPFGYGKAVYLTLETGETVVYAHLSELSPELDSVICQAQLSAGRYRVDIYHDAGELPIRSGDVLGYAGRTGTVAPHLHFEVRDKDQNPLNPLAIGWELEDGEHPRIHGVGWVPLTPSARVNGLCFPRIGELDDTGANLYTATDTVRLEGRVGLSVRIIDRLDESSGRLAPYRVELHIDDKLMTAIELQRFSYSHTGEVELAYDMERARAAGRHYLFLFQREGETLWNRNFKNGGVIDTDSLDSRGVHTAEIKTFDRGGNLTRALLSFVIEDKTSPADAAPVPAPMVHVSDAELPGCFFLGDLLSLHPEAIAWGAIPRAAETSDAATIPEPLEWAATVRETAGPWSFGVTHSGTVQPVNVYPVTAGEVTSGSLSMSSGGDVRVTTRDESFYADAFMYLTEWPGRVDKTVYPRDEMTPLTAAARLGPLALVCKGSIEIAFSLEREGDGREAVYRLRPREKKWSFVSSFVKADTVSAYIGSPGVYAVFTDTLPPRIKSPIVASRTSYATGKDSPELVIPIADEGCGLDYENTEILIDETKQIARWDGFLQKMFILLENKNVIGEHDLRVVAVDRVGNTSQIVSKFHVPPVTPHGGKAATDASTDSTTDAP
jgi:hypothetical protein